MNDLNKEKYKNRRSFFLIISIILIAANLRTPITAITPLLPMMRHDIVLSNTMAGFLTTLPLLSFSIVSPFVSKLSTRLGMEMTIFLSLILLTIGSLIRPFGNMESLLIGTFLIGLAIAVGNVLLPSIIKAKFPFKLGIMISIYSISMSLCAAFASGLSVPIALIDSFGWQGSLLIWSSIVIFALLFWVTQLKFNQKQDVKITRASATKSIWSSRLAWMITIMMGMQSSLFYIAITWLPDILHSHHFTQTESGLMLSVMQIGIMIATFIVPIIASTASKQKILVILTTSCLCIGVLGIFYSYQLITLSVSIFIFGAGAGTAFGLCMMFFNLRTKTIQEAADLSGMAQSFGYLLAAIGPILFGAVHEITNSWNGAMLIMLTAILSIFICGMHAATDRYVFDILKKSVEK